jgi:hypothetical protein
MRIGIGSCAGISGCLPAAQESYWTPLVDILVLYVKTVRTWREARKCPRQHRIGDNDISRTFALEIRENAD